VVASSFAADLLAGDPGRAAAHFAPSGQLITPDGTEVRGLRSIATVLAQLTAPEQRLEIRIGRTVVTENVALSTQYWLRGSGHPDGPSLEMTTTAWLVLQHDERWQILIASPWG
jgi:ketosteroid isomerase-like protein